MPCDTIREPNQTLPERKKQITETVAELGRQLVSGKMKAVVGPQGAVTFTGADTLSRNRVTDACAYRRLMATGSALAKQQIAKAELLAGRSVNKQVVAQGIHSHDGGRTWHGKG